MKWLQLQDYMIVVLAENTEKLYENLPNGMEEAYALYKQFVLEDEMYQKTLIQFGINPLKPSYLQSYEVEQGTAQMFTGKFYFEGYLEMGELDEWDIICGDTVLSFTNEEPAPFAPSETSYVEISFEMIKRVSLV